MGVQKKVAEKDDAGNGMGQMVSGAGHTARE